MNPDVRIRDGWREALWAFLGARVLLTVCAIWLAANAVRGAQASVSPPPAVPGRTVA